MPIGAGSWQIHCNPEAPLAVACAAVIGDGSPPRTAPPAIAPAASLPDLSAQTGPRLLPAPRLPRSSLGGRLEAAQKEELWKLQQQVQLQLRQQRLLVDSIRHAGQESIAARAEKLMASLVEQDEALEKICSGERLAGPHPTGDLPAADPESDEPLPLRYTPRLEELGTARPVRLELQCLTPWAERALPAAMPPGPLLANLEGKEEAGSGEPVFVPPIAEAEAEPCREAAKVGRKVEEMIPALAGGVAEADEAVICSEAPTKEERRWIDAAVRRMFRALKPDALEAIVGEFREWRLPASTAIVRQNAPVTTGPGLCVLFQGVVDVLHCPKGAVESEKVCTYDRCGQCFGELELFYAPPGGSQTGRRAHWATIATRTHVVLWTISRSVLRNSLPGASGEALGLVPRESTMEQSRPQPRRLGTQPPGKK